MVKKFIRIRSNVPGVVKHSSDITRQSSTVVMNAGQMPSGNRKRSTRGSVGKASMMVCYAAMNHGILEQGFFHRIPGKLLKLNMLL